MLLMVEKGKICHAVHKYAKGNNKYMKDYNKNKESSYIQCLDTENYINGQCLKVTCKWI